MTNVDPFMAIADPNRRHILEDLRRGEKTVNELAGQLPISRPAVSQHLKALLDSGLVHQHAIAAHDAVAARQDLAIFCELELHRRQGLAHRVEAERVGEDRADEMVEINIMQDLRYLHFPLADIMTKAACHIANGGRLSGIGMPINNAMQKVTFQPVYNQNSIKGHVSYIDSFGNVISNISKELFNKVQEGREFILRFKRNETISKMSWHYNEVSEGEKLCLFGISNFLEIAINKGHAAQLLGLHQDETILIEFLDKR